MFDDTEVANDLLTILDNWFKPFLELIGDNLYLQSLIILVVFFSTAKLLAYIITKVILHLSKNSKTNAYKEVAEILQLPVFYTILMLGIGAVIHWLNIAPWAYKITISIIASLASVMWLFFFFRLTRILLTSLAYRDNNRSIVQVDSLPLFINLSIVLFSTVAFYKLFQAWHIDMSAWIASAGIVGIAIGFAAKDTLANLFTGVFIMMDAPYKIGDFIVLDSGERGKVTHIGIRSTRILTRDDVEVTIPNSIIGNTKVMNESGGPHKKYRIRVKVSAAYGSDTEQIRKVLIDVAHQQSCICHEPEPRVRFRELGDSGLLFELLCWIDEPVLLGSSMNTMNEAVYNRFIKEGIEIPYSKQDVYIKDFPRLDVNSIK